MFLHGEMGDQNKCEIFDCSEGLDLADRQTDTQTHRQTADRETYRQVKKNTGELNCCELGREKVTLFVSGKMFYAHILKCLQSYASIFTS